MTKQLLVVMKYRISKFTVFMPFFKESIDIEGFEDLFFYTRW